MSLNKSQLTFLYVRFPSYKLRLKFIFPGQLLLDVILVAIKYYSKM